MMKAKPYALVTVRMPLDLHDVLETIAVTKGETLSVVVRDLVRQAAFDARRAPSLKSWPAVRQMSSVEIESRRTVAPRPLLTRKTFDESQH